MAEQAQVSIKDFIIKKENETKEVKLKRFASPFIIREVTTEESEAIQKKAVKKSKNFKTGRIESEPDQQLAGELMLAQSVVQPDLHNAELQKAYGTIGDELATLKAMVKLGEFTQLANAFNDISGLNASVDEEVDTVKN